MTVAVERKSQILKGVLDLCVLSVLEVDGPTYGYGLVSALEANGLPLVAEGSVYPLLARLAKVGLLETFTQPSPTGPARKYYSITSDGKAALRDGANDWFTVAGHIETLLRKTHDRV